MRKISAAVLDRADGPVELTTLELDGPGDLEVVVRISAGGVCRTDALARRGALPFPLPGVLGHEGAGVVATVGDAVEGFSPGDRVVIGRPFCGACRACRAGHPRHCLRLAELLIGGGPVLRRPDGTRVAVFGANLTGLAAVLAARVTPATRIVVVDRDPARLDRALSLGATHVVDASVSDPVEAVADLCGGPADAAVECTGDPTAIRPATDSLDVLGVCVLAGDPPPGTLISLDHERARAGRRVVGVPPGGTPALMTALIEFYAQGRFPIDGLLDERPFAEVEAAIDSTLADDVRKPVLRMPPE